MNITRYTLFPFRLKMQKHTGALSMNVRCERKLVDYSICKEVPEE